MVALTSWGRLGSFEHFVSPLRDPISAARAVTAARGGNGFGIAHGGGRSYGDVCLNPGGVAWLMTGLDHLIEFDSSSGRLRCEAGVTLGALQSLFVPTGWILPVTPGTQFVTVGGAIANDVHGKNHHRSGSFGRHVKSLRLLRTDGEVIDCGPQQRRDWFAATVGGAGLTGVIIEATLQLRRVSGPWLSVETVPYGNLDEFLSISDGSEPDWEYTVSWIDCLSGSKARGIFMRANHIDEPGPSAEVSSARPVPCALPFSLVNGISLRAFNQLYFHRQKTLRGKRRQHYQPFFYPLDRLLHWNRIYGPNGFYQYQCSMPRSSALDALKALLAAISRAGEGSFLAVLKTFGEQPAEGLLSFPLYGATLALDFPNRGQRSERLFQSLDAIVNQAGGRLYLAKDARMPKAVFENGYAAGLAGFHQYRDPGISSALSRRLFGS